MRRLEAAERALSAEIKGAMLRAGVTSLPGNLAVALLDERCSLKPDPSHFIAATGAAGVRALRVDVTEARRLLAPEALTEISERTTSHVLRCEPIRPAAGSAA